MSIITLASDYGSSDGYTGAMCGVIKSIAPNAEIIQITDGLTSVSKAALALFRYYSFFPKGTIHLIVIDPKVGSSRRALVGEGGGYYFVGPDNAIFTRVISLAKDSKWYSIDIASLPNTNISSTFHGRDIFAPAAAMLANGKNPADLGNNIADPMVLSLPDPIVKKDKIVGEVIDIDNFGNLITNIRGEMLTGHPKYILMNNVNTPFGNTFSDVPSGKPIAYVGSLNYLEIAVNMGRANIHLNGRVGTLIEVIF